MRNYDNYYKRFDENDAFPSVRLERKALQKRDRNHWSSKLFEDNMFNACRMNGRNSNLFYLRFNL